MEEGESEIPDWVSFFIEISDCGSMSALLLKLSFQIQTGTNYLGHAFKEEKAD